MKIIYITNYASDWADNLFRPAVDQNQHQIFAGGWIVPKWPRRAPAFSPLILLVIPKLKKLHTSMTKLHCAAGLYVGEEFHFSLQAGLLCWYWPTVCCFAPCEPPFQQSPHLVVRKRSNNHNATRKVAFSKSLFIYSYSTLSEDSINHIFKLYFF